jgi:hypothetical protein
MMASDVAALGRSLGLVGAATAYFGKRTANSFIEAASTMQQYEAVMMVVLKSQEKVNDMMGFLVDTARQVPQTFEDVLNMGTQLSVIFGGNAQDVKAWTPLILDLASVIKVLGIDLKETTGQFSRLYSAGAGAVDLFRDRGVMQILGFDPKEIEEGIDIGEVRRRIWEAWTKDDSLFRGATEKMKEQWVGQVSMMHDSWFLFKKEVMSTSIFSSLIGILASLNNAINKNWGAITQWIHANDDAIVSTLLWTTAVVGLTIAFGTLFGIVVPLFTTVLTGGVSTVRLLAVSFGYLGTTIMALASPLKLLGTIISSVRVLFLATLLPIGLGIAAVAAFAATAYVLRAVWNKNLGDIQGYWQAFVDVFPPALDNILTNIKTWSMAFVDWCKWGVNKAIGVYSLFFTNIYKGFSGVTSFLGKMTSVIGKVMDPKSYGKEENGDPYGFFKDPIGVGTAWMEGLKRTINGGAKELMDEQVAIFNHDYIGEMVGGLGGAAVDQAEWAYGEVAKIGEITKEQFDSDMASLKQSLLEQFPLATKMVQDFFASVQDPAAGMGLVIEPTFGGTAGDEPKGLSESAMKAMQKALERLKEEATDVRLKVYPAEALAADIMNLSSLSQKFPEILDKGALFEAFKNLWTDYREDGLNANMDISKAMAIVPEQYRSMFELAKNEAEEMALTMEAITDQNFEVNEKLQAGFDAISNIQGPTNAMKEMASEMEAIKFAMPEMIRQGRVTALESRNLLNELYWQNLSNIATLSIEEIGTALSSPDLSPVQIDLLSDALKTKLKDTVDQLPDSIEAVGESLSKAFDSQKIAQIAKAGATISGSVLKILDLLKTAPAMFQAMSAAGLSTAFKIAVAMHMAFTVLALIADAIIAITTLFGGMGDKGEKELKGIKKVIEEIKTLSEQWMNGLIDSLIEFARTGELTFKELIDSMLEDLFRLTTMELILKPIVNLVGGALPGFAKGGAFDGGVQYFAKGGVVTAPTSFGMKNGTGVMGEAGPEVVAPLRRMRNGEMGIGAVGGGSKTEVNVYASGIPAEMIHVEESKNSSGGDKIEIFLDNWLKKGLAQGKFNRAMALQFSNMQRRPT